MLLKILILVTFTILLLPSNILAKTTPISNTSAYTVDVVESFSVKGNVNKLAIKVGAVLYSPFVIRGVPTISFDKEISLKGIEVDLINLIAERMNLTPEYILSTEDENWGEICDENLRQSTGLVGLLMRGEVDLAIGGITPEISRYAIIDSSIKYGQDEIIWIVPVRVMGKGWKALLNAVDINVCLLLILAASFTVFVYFAASIYLGDSKLGGGILKRMLQQFFIVYHIIVGHTINDIPSSSFSRFILIQWLGFALIWNTLLKGYLTSTLTIPIIAAQVQSIQELLKSNYKVTVPVSISNWTYFGINHQLMVASYKLRSKYEICDHTFACLAKVAADENYVTLARRKSFVYIKDNFVDAYGYALLGLIQQQVTVAPLEIMFRKDHPLLQRFNVWIRRAIEYGFIHRFEKMAEFQDYTKYTSAKIIARNLKIGDGPQPLNWKNIKNIFVIYFVLNTFCLAIFIGEIMFNTLKCTNNR